MSEDNDNVRDMISRKPYKSSAEKYKARGWNNPIPLPANKKSPPPTGFTGRPNPEQGMGKTVDYDQMRYWIDHPDFDRANIGVRLDIVEGHDHLNGGKAYFDVIGIDVDHHPDDPDDPKNGGTQLEHIEAKLGKLPDTWTSSARTNGVAGIRFFLVPLQKDNKGNPIRLGFRGDCGELGGVDIDIIQHVHRFAAVYPSFHPNGGQYLWYPTGVNPSGPTVLKDVDWVKEVGLKERDSRGISEIPVPIRNFAELPGAWVDFLTRNRIEDSGISPIDMESSDKTVEEWCKLNLSPNENYCDKTEARVKSILVKIEQSDTSHNILTRAHMNIMKMAAREGHSGWRKAIEEINAAWLQDVVSRKKRSEVKARNEIHRSFYGAMRKIKGSADHATTTGVPYLLGHDPCDIGILPGKADGTGNHIGPSVPTSPTRPPEEYPKNDDGNAEHFLHMYQGNLRYVPNVLNTWIYWDKHRWNVDNVGVVGHLFRGVALAQIRAGLRLEAEGVLQNNPQKEEMGQKLQAWGVRSGNRQQSANARSAAKDFPGISLKYEELDSDPYILGVANGVIRFNTKEYREKLIRKGKPDKPFAFIQGSADMRDRLVTQNTRVPYIPMLQQEAIAKFSQRAEWVDGQGISDGKGGDIDIWIDYEGNDRSGFDGVQRKASTGNAKWDKAIREGYGLFWDMMNKFLGPRVLTKSTREYLPKLFGYMLLGHNDSKVATFLFGESNTGKSTFQKLLTASVGDYGAWRAPAIFVNKTLNPLLATALSKRIVCIGEIGKRDMDAELFKNITGNEPVTCELKGKNNAVEMVARCSIVSGCNSAPTVADEDKATRNRFLVVPFKHQVTSTENDPKASDRIENLCRATMLAWLIEGCGKAIIEGVTEHPDEISMETKDFVSKLSNLSDFIDECLEVCPKEMWVTYGVSQDLQSGKALFKDDTDWYFTNEALWQRYQMWQTNSLTNKEFISKHKLFAMIRSYDVVKQDGVKKIDGKTQRVWVGARIKGVKIKT